jgi:hypothetical protein
MHHAGVRLAHRFSSFSRCACRSLGGRRASAAASASASGERERSEQAKRRWLLRRL